MRPRPLIWTERSAQDLEEIEAYIAADDPIAAERWVRTLIGAATRAGELPLSGRIVPEMGREDVRELIKKSYRIIYWVFDDRVEILTVLEGHRRLPKDLLTEGSEASD